MKKIIRKSMKKEECFLSWMKIGTNVDDMKYLAGGLKGNTSVINLDLSGNCIGSNVDDMKYLAEGLKANTRVTTLNLNSNVIGSKADDMKYLAEGLKGNSSLISLDLSINYIGNNADDMKYLAEGLKRNSSLISLDLSINYIGTGWKQELNRIEKNKNRLQPLDCLAYEVILKNDMKCINDYVYLNACMSNKLKKNKIHYII